MPHKLVVRRLPPNLPEDIFWKAVQPWVNEQNCLWRRYVRDVFCRAYILMDNPENVVAFHQGFDGHIFRSKQGEYQAVVEFAPYQKTPHNAKSKADVRQGTIDDDPDYKSYLESMDQPIQIEPVVVVQPTSTPLLDHLRATKKAKEKAKREVAKGEGSVNKAASKRDTKEPQGKLVAGKGKEEVAAGPGSNLEAKKARKKKPKGNKEDTKDSPNNPPVPKAKAKSKREGRSVRPQQPAIVGILANPKTGNTMKGDPTTARIDT